MTKPELEIPDTATGNQLTGHYGVPVPGEASHSPTANKIIINFGSPFCSPLPPNDHHKPTTCR